MNINFFQLRNNTAFTFNLINTENQRGNYDVGPWVTTARGDMWLAMGSGEKGVSVLTFNDGSAIYSLLFMWDQDSALRYRLGGETQTRAISVNGSKDFSIDVYDTHLTFVCYNGSFNSSQSTVTVDDWKGSIINHFGDLVSNTEVLRYARQFAGASPDELRSPLQLRGGIQLPTEAQVQAITNLVAMWEDNYLEHNRRQSTLYSDGNGWRIDLQENGAVVRNGMRFYNIAVQYGGGRDNVYAHIMLPVGYVIGRRRVRNAILHSMHTSQVMVIVPPESGLHVVQAIAYNSDTARNSWSVQSLQWLCTDARDMAWR